MTDKKKADQPASPKRTNLDDTSSVGQRQRLLKYMQIGPIDTLTARSELAILHPAGRVYELRDKGYVIQKQTITVMDEQGVTHSGIALYYLPTYAANDSEEAN